MIEKIYIVQRAYGAGHDSILISPGFSNFTKGYNFLKNHIIEHYGKNSWEARKRTDLGQYDIPCLNTPKRPFFQYKVTWIRIL